MKFKILSIDGGGIKGLYSSTRNKSNEIVLSDVDFWCRVPFALLQTVCFMYLPAKNLEASTAIDRFELIV